MSEEWTHVRMKSKLKGEIDDHVQTLQDKENISTTGYIERAVRNALEADGVNI